MKILMVLESTFPPDIRVRRQAKQLVDRGHEVEILCQRRAEESATEDIEGISVTRVSSPRRPIYEFNELCRHILLLAPHWYQEIRGTVTNESYDIVHVHDLPLLPTVRRALRGTMIPVVADFHELYPESVVEWRKALPRRHKLRPHVLFKPAWRLKRAEARHIEEVQGLITVSPEQLAYYEEDYDLRDVETAVVRNVPDLDHFDQIPVEDLGYDGFVASYIGGFSPQRGLETTIDAIARLLGNVPEARLLLVGDGNDEYVRSLEQRCEDRGIRKSVEFTGWVDFERVPSYFAASDVTLVPSIGDNTDTECSLPNKLFQSMATGTPVVVSDLDAMGSVVKDAECGIVVQRDSPAALADALVELNSDPERRCRLGENGRRAVETTYNFAAEGDSLAALYERILNPCT